jgi:hypothetical protein
MTLLEDSDVLGVETKERVALEKLFGVLPGRSAGHDVPRHDNGSLGFAMLALSNLLKASDPLRLQLEERLVGRKPDVVTALRRTAAKTCALPACHQEHCDLACSYGGKALGAKLGPTVRASDHGLGRILREGFNGL